MFLVQALKITDHTKPFKIYADLPPLSVQLYYNVMYVLMSTTESLPGVIDVRFAEREPAEKRCLLSWEQVH